MSDDKWRSRGTLALRWILRAVIAACFILAVWGNYRGTRSPLIDSPLWRAILFIGGFVLLGVDRLFPRPELPPLRVPFQRRADDEES
jgi:hypothetical protein